MATRDFTAFIMKCVGKTFPDADLSKGSPVWTFLINPVVEYAGTGALDLQTREFIKTVMRSQFPGQELDKDGVVDDTLIKPAEALLSPIVREIQQIKTRQTLADLRFHTIESISDIATNFSVVPKSGDYARGPVRLYYAAPVNERVVAETYVEATSGGLRFFASSQQSISAAQMALNQENDLYYWDIRVVAEKPGTAYNVKTGAISRAPTLSRVVRVRNLYDFFGGLSRDTVESIASALDSYPSTRSIGTRRGTVATIQALIGAARVIEMIGMGDPEMMRDIIRGGEIQPTLVTGASGSGGYAIPDNAADCNTKWMEDPAADFVALLGSSSTVIDGYYLGMVWDTGTASPNWVFSKIVSVLSTTRLELEDRCIPVSMFGKTAATSIRWGIFPAKLTLSEVPGGILWPDTPDGLVVIRDNEVHVGGCSDTFILGTTVESTSTDMTAVSDETPAGFGVQAATTVSKVDVYLDDAPVVEILSSAVVTVVSTAVIEFAAYVWGVTDLTALQAGQVVEIPTATPDKRFVILQLDRNTSTGALRLLLDAHPGAGPYSAKVVKRTMTLPRDACLHIYPPSADAGYYKVLSQSEGAHSDVYPSGYHGCRYFVRLDRPMTDTATGIRWEITDTIDIDLNAPKQLRIFGADLNTFAGAASVFSTTLDFSMYGVVSGDILRIESGPDSGKLHVLGKDPFGLGSRFLELTDTLTTTSVVSFSIYAASTPLALPLVSVSKVSLLDVGGSSLGVDVPYKDPLSGYTSEFTNLASGVKHESADWTVGIASVGGVKLDGTGENFDFGSFSCSLFVWHRQLGYSPICSGGPHGGYADGDMELPEGGFIRPVQFHYKASATWDISKAGGWNAMVAYLNSYTPYPFWDWTIWEDVNGDQYGRLICRPFGAHLMVLACEKSWEDLTGVGGSPIRFDPFLDYLGTEETYVVGAGSGGLASYTGHVTSKDLYYGSTDGVSTPTDTILAGMHPPLNTDQDIADVYTGSNIDTKNMLMQVEGTHHRFRIAGRRSYHPELDVSVRLGFPSTGTSQLFFRDPTDLEINSDTRLTVDSGQVYWPDPMLNTPIVPGYPETDKPIDGYYVGVYTPSGTQLGSTFARSSGEPDFLSLGAMPGDILEISYKDLVTGQDWSGPLSYDVVGTDQVLYIRQVGKPLVSVTFPVATGYTITSVIDKINAAMGSTVAIVSGDFISLRWQEKIEIYGSATGNPNILDVCPADNVSLSFGLWPILEVGYLASPWEILVKGVMDSTETVGTNLQFKILRRGTQRFSSKLMSETTGPGPYYSVEGEFLSWGVGNQFNIHAGVHGQLSGHWSRGYSLSCENQELSYSMTEVPWMHIGNYFQPPTEVDEMPNDQIVLGGGLRIYYDRSPLVSSTQALLNSREEKDNIQSALARHLFPHYVSFTASYAGGALPTAVNPEIIDLITGRDPSEPLDVSDIIGVLTQFGANKVDMPLALAVNRHNEDRTQDLLIGNDRVETTRLTGFLPGTITLNRRA